MRYVSYDSPTTPRPPAVFLSHGAPPSSTIGLGSRSSPSSVPTCPGPLGDPRRVRPLGGNALTIGATDPTVPLTYDFYGFPERYYQTRYAPPTRRRWPPVAAMIPDGEPVHHDTGRRLDHGAYVPLTVMYPDAGSRCYRSDAYARPDTAHRTGRAPGAVARRGC